MSNASRQPVILDLVSVLKAREAKLAKPLSDGVRTELVARARAMIDAGTYLTPEKLSIGVDGLIRDAER